MSFEIKRNKLTLFWEMDSFTLCTDRFNEEMMVFGWTTESSTSTDEPYTLFNCGQTQVGGMAELQNPEVPSHWMGYIAVADVDAATGAAKALGASVYCPPTDIPGIGRFATLGGPCGATFAVFTTSHGCGCDG